MLDLVDRSKLMPDDRDFLSTAEECCDDLWCLMNDILDIAKIDARKMTFDTVAFNPRQLVDDLLPVLAGTIGETPVALETSYAPDSRQQFVGDPMRLCQIVKNLVGNALKFTL